MSNSDSTTSSPAAPATPTSVKKTYEEATSTLVRFHCSSF